MAGTLFSNAVINFAVNTQNALQQITGFQQKFSNTIGQLKGLVAGFIGFQGLKGAYNTLTQLIDTADKWNIPVEKVSKFSNLFAEFGGTTDEAVASLDKFQQMANQLKFHSSGPLRELSAVLRTNLANKDYMGVIKALRSQWGLLNSDAQAEVQNMLGLDSAAMRRMLSASNEEFAEAVKRAEKFGVVTEDTAKAIRDMRKALAETKQALVMLAVPFLELLKPVLEIVRDLAVWINQLPTGVKQFAAAMIMLYPVISKLMALFTGGSIVKGLAALSNPVTLIIAGVAALAAGIYVLWKNWDKVSAKIDEWKQKFPGLKVILDIITAQFKMLWTAAKAVFDIISGIVNVLSKIGSFIGDVFTAGNKKLTTEEKEQANDWLTQNGLIPSEETARNMSYVNNNTKDSHNTKVIDNKTQTINIYGVQGAEDMMSRLQSIPQQSLTPIMGVQGQ